MGLTISYLYGILLLIVSAIIWAFLTIFYPDLTFENYLMFVLFWKLFSLSDETTETQSWLSSL